MKQQTLWLKNILDLFQNEPDVIKRAVIIDTLRERGFEEEAQRLEVVLNSCQLCGGYGQVPVTINYVNEDHYYQEEIINWKPCPNCHE